MRNPIRRAARAGFTLVEVLVTLVLIALLVGVVVPGVIGQLGSGESTRILEDTESVRSAGKMFRIDVKRFPAALHQLTVPPTTPWDITDDINGAEIPTGLQERWSGPYLEVGTIAALTDTLRSAAGAEIGPLFETTTLNGTDFWTIRIAHVDTSSIEEIDLEIDGTVDLAAGRIQAAESVGQDTTFMLYLAAPIN